MSNHIREIATTISKVQQKPHRPISILRGSGLYKSSRHQKLSGKAEDSRTGG